MNNLKIAVISDIHGNAESLKKVLENIKLLSVDLTIFLGDLLTYGCQPLEVLDALDAYQVCHKSIFIKGNHDQFYFDQAVGKKSFDYVIPEFVSESILWTTKRLKRIQLQSMFDWKESFSIGSIYFSHANPFRYGDWRYVESSEQCFEASDELIKKGFKVGVFGHSHRKSAVKVSKKNGYSKVNGYSICLNEPASYILNPGSIGQARGEGLSYMILVLQDSKLDFKFYNVDIDMTISINLINKSKMSFSTKKKLISYLGVKR